jgi:NADPH-ferrihemoprotein reductase
METSSEASLFDTTDILLLATIGFGTVAWFTRQKLMTLLTGKKKETSTATNTTTTTKRETNFVKVMEQQVRINNDSIIV